MDSKKVIDLPEVANYIGDGESPIAGIVARWFVRETTTITKLDEAIKAKDAEKIFLLVSKIKKIAVTINADCLAKAILVLEIACKEGKLEDAEVLFAGLQKEFDRVKLFVSQSN